jgi:cytoskeletal protein RodZ
MRKSYISLLAVAIMITSIVIAGCTTSNQSNQGASSETSSNASTSSTTKVATHATTATTSKVTPSPSASPSASPTATPSTAGRIATSIQFVSDPNVAKGTSLGIDVTASGITICGHGAVTATIGTVSSGGSSDCFRTAYLDTSGLNPGTYDITLKFTGDSTYQPSQLTSKIIIT